MILKGKTCEKEHVSCISKLQNHLSVTVGSTEGSCLLNILATLLLHSLGM